MSHEVSTIDIGPGGEALHGLIGLSVPVFALIGAVNHYRDVARSENLGVLAADLVLLAERLLMAQSLYETTVNIL